MACDMCGKEGQLFRAIIEGTEMSVCSRCAAFGKVIPRPQMRQLQKRSVLPEKEIAERIVEDYSELIKKSREKLGLEQKDFALRLNEKESIIHKIETSHMRPSIPLARKIEKFLKIILVQQEEVAREEIKAVKSESYTLGDFIKVKK